ncbi:hypothetical protein ES703_54400 [subsurface metagenome]
MKRVKWYLVLLLVGILLFVGGCIEKPTEEPLESEEPLLLESMIAHSQPVFGGGWQYWIEAKLIPLGKAKVDTWYAIELQKVGYTVNTQGVKWCQGDLKGRLTKTVKFGVQKEELPSVGTNLEAIYSIKIREETDERVIQFWEELNWEEQSN